MDYETKPLKRVAIRNISKFVRKIFDCKSDDEIFPTLMALEKLPDVLPNSNYRVVDNSDLPGNVFACCFPKPEGGYEIQIKQTVYDGAKYYNNPAFLSFICHEICHLVLFYLGFTPVSNCAINTNKGLPAFKSVEWQAKALCGEVTIPYEATIGMTKKEIMTKYNVTEASAKYRRKLKA